MGFNEDKTLKVNWSKKENDWMIHYQSRPTGHMTNGFLDGRIDFPEFLKELKDRGYDINTLKLTVNKRQFKCIKEYKAEQKHYKMDTIYYLRYEQDELYEISDGNGYSCDFSKNKKLDNYIGNYFIEINY